MKRLSLILLAGFAGLLPASAQDSVDVTFRYVNPGGAGNVSLVGEFNGWSPGLWPMTYIGGNTFVRTARLKIGYAGRLSGAYQYKFYTGAVPWPNDPLNHHVNTQDNDNSILYVRDPTIYQFIPNQRSGVVREETPEISAYLFPKVGSSVDTGSIVLRVNEKIYTGLGVYYNDSTKQFRFRLPDALASGVHKLWITAGSNSDSVSIMVQAGFIQITNLGNVVTRNPERTLYGLVEDSSISTVQIVRNDRDTLEAGVSNGAYSLRVTLVEGLNTFKAIAYDPTGTLRQSPSVSFTYFVNHSPTARIVFVPLGGDILLTAAQSTDPDSGHGARLQYLWSVDPRNPELMAGVEGSVQRDIRITRPGAAGEYYFRLIVTDPDGNRDTTRNFFVIRPDGQFEETTTATVPEWVRRGRLYQLFFKSLTPEGTINAALPFLPYFKSLGVNILWVMPVMENAFPMNNTVGTGYNIKDFFKVAPEYGTNEDFKNFVRQAHELGLKIILDVTPNHTSFAHPFAQEAKQFKRNSFYWDFYQHQIIPHFENNVGPQRFDPDSFVYYDKFSSQLLNYNWSDIDARHYMTEVYKWWVKEFGIDGYRYDVYWGPRRRYGEQTVGAPLRQALRHIKPDIFLLAEDDGTGTGSEVIYADRGGGVDSGYDWLLYWDAIRPLYERSLDNLNNRVTNFGGNTMGFVPGPNSTFLRFMENHDEDRIAHLYGSYEKTMPVSSVLFTVPGMPMIYSGQEVGYGLGITNFDGRRRGVIDWRAGGRTILQPHYQRLAHIRAQFPAFSTQTMVRIPTSNSLVYAFSRPLRGEDGLTVTNFSSNSENVSIALGASSLATSISDGKTYYANDLYNDTTYALVFAEASTTLPLTLKPYGSAIFVLADTIRRLNLTPLVSVPVSADRRSSSVPSDFRLYQNFPNPFNPSTTFRFDVPLRGHVRLTIFNVLGEEVISLVDEVMEAGTHQAVWNAVNGRGQRVGSGLYVARIRYQDRTETRKVLLLR